MPSLRASIGSALAVPKRKRTQLSRPTAMPQQQPSITVVTPVLNQAQYIEQTIESVLSQGIENLNYVILDAGSTDGTVDIIRRYESHLTFWRSHKDAGQSAAIKEGFEVAPADLQCWINSDDYFEPGALKRMVDRFAQDDELQLCYGDYSILLPNGCKEPKLKISFDFDICYLFYLMIPQPSSVWRRSLYEAVGGLDVSMHYSFDLDFFLQVGWSLRDRKQAIRHVHDLVSVFRVHPESKSVAQSSKFIGENARAVGKIQDYPKWKLSWWHRKLQIARTLACYHRERGVIPTKKDKRKA